MKHRVTTATLLALSSAMALAQSSENDAGLYLGGGWGQFDVQVDDIDDADEAISRIDDDDNAWKIFVGWRVNPYFSFELAYVDFGENSGSTGGRASGSSGNYALELAGVQPAVYGTFPIGPVELFAKLGYYFYDVDITANLDDLGGDLFTSDTSDEAWSYGGGVGLTFFERVHAKLEYEKIDTDVVDDLDSIWLTGAWRF